MARCAWTLFDEEVTAHVDDNSPDARQWLFAMRNTLDQSKFVLMLTTLWVIWTARRKAIH
jgi:hypothetical protein